MANILMINFPAEGHVNPTLGMVKAFSDRGDAVHYITAERFKERLENAGAIVHTHRDLLSGVSIKPETAQGINAFLNIHIQTSLDTLKLVHSLSKKIDFDFVFYDKFGAGELVRDYLRIPGIVSSASFLMPKERLAMMPLHPDSDVPFKPDEKAQYGLSLLKNQFGVEPKNLLQFMNNEGELTVVYTSRFFQPLHERFDESCLFIGPSFPKRHTSHDFPLEKLRDEKVLYVSMGTVLDDVEGFFNLCIDAFSDFDGKVVIAAGDRADFKKIRKAPEHFIISPYVPQLDVLKEADVFITHGGMNSVNEAIHFNVPLVVLPHGKDQPLVAQRLVELNAGYRLAKETVNASLLRSAVDEVIHDDRYKKGIKEINVSFEQAAGPAAAAEKIVNHVVKQHS
ncbi:UDP-glucosyltransferase [Priestia megaterium]|uniref:macrolide family glycosyltransferase n=1 Tax=Priestia megaterium TaxID=1404 RepID=UPI001B3A7109|nr:macrolide family glycosyltransferase [Priestia megaterium]MBQ4866565.1 UDP-glucosyltransferase [Priestia megaterium]MEB2275140.1 UDP-glucosyltransferase [Bacillus sp. ILBB4]